MEIFPKFSYFANRHPLCFTDIGLGQGESTLSCQNVYTFIYLCIEVPKVFSQSLDWNFVFPYKHKVFH